MVIAKTKAKAGSVRAAVRLDGRGRRYQGRVAQRRHAQPQHCRQRQPEGAGAGERQAPGDEPGEQRAERGCRGQADVAHHAVVGEHVRVVAADARHERQAAGVVGRAAGAQQDEGDAEGDLVGCGGDGEGRQRGGDQRDAYQRQGRHAVEHHADGDGAEAVDQGGGSERGAERRVAGREMGAQHEEHGREEADEQVHHGVRQVHGRQRARGDGGSGVTPRSSSRTT